MVNFNNYFYLNFELPDVYFKPVNRKMNKLRVQVQESG
jgi:hypothetical protein